jgi:hypothetical protein
MESEVLRLKEAVEAAIDRAFRERCKSDATQKNVPPVAKATLQMVTYGTAQAVPLTNRT